MLFMECLPGKWGIHSCDFTAAAAVCMPEGILCACWESVQHCEHIQYYLE